MCGRYTLLVGGEAVGKLFELPEGPQLEPRYNIAPTQDVPVVLAGPDGRRVLRVMRWGLIPAWADAAAIGNRLINARAETAAQKPAFRSAFQKRRCLIAADGFYEWLKAPGGKQPYHIRLADGLPFGFAGLWETWTGGGQEVCSCTILTTDANDLLRPIHDRMPVIIDRPDHQRWLTADAGRVGELLRPFPAERMECYPVSRRVNSPAHEGPDCIRGLE